MIRFFSIDAVHPVLKRVVKSNLPSPEANVLYKELLDAGYEENNIIFKPTLIIMESGDRIELSSEFMDHITDDLQFSKIEGDRDLFNVKTIFNFIFNNDVPPVIKGTLKKMSIIKEGEEEMYVIWDGVDGMWKQTNVNILKTIGYKFD